MTLKKETIEKIDKLTDKEKATLLVMCMESIRGSWSFAEDRMEIIRYICDGLKHFIPQKDLQSLKAHAQVYPDFDGRIFRDASPSYDELWKNIGKDTEAMKKVYNLILQHHDDLTYEDLWDDSLN